MPLGFQNNPMSPILLFCIGVLLFMWVVTFFQWIWNITVPDIFKLPKINFWQAFRLLLLSAMLFGGSWIRLGAGG